MAFTARTKLSKILKPKSACPSILRGQHESDFHALLQRSGYRRESNGGHRSRLQRRGQAIGRGDLQTHEESLSKTSRCRCDLHARIGMATAESRAAIGTRPAGAGDLQSRHKTLGRAKALSRARAREGLWPAAGRIAIGFTQHVKL